MDVRLPDGTLIRNVPDGMSRADLTAKLKANGYDISKLEAPAPAAEPSMIGKPSDMLAGAKNTVMGAVRGAAGIGATIMQPFQALEDKLTGGNANADTRAGIEGGVAATGADPKSLAFQGAKLGTEIAGTAGVGGALAAPLRTVAPRLASSIASGGFTTGAPAAGNALANIGTRTVGGAVTGGASAGLVDPESADTGALIGGALPGGVKVAGAVGGKLGGLAADAANWTSERLMQSALKPTIDQLRSGEAAIAVKTLLERGINATGGGVNKLRALVDDLNTQISDKISGSTATIDKQKVVGALGETRQKFSNQVSPTGDLNAISSVEQDFLAHPNLPGNDIPVQAAQQMKQGTYKVLKGKYGEAGSAQTEAQKSLARGLKDEIATAVPGVGELNAEESRLLSTLNVVERRALMDMNKNPMGLAALAGNPLSWAAFLADRSAAFKSLAARMVNSATPSANSLQRLTNFAPPQVAYRAAPVVAADQ